MLPRRSIALLLAATLFTPAAMANQCVETKSVLVHGPLKVGQPAPDFGGWTPSNELFSSTRFMLERPGQALVVSFFATWCKPCERGLPVLQKLNDELKGEASVVLVAFGHDAAEVNAYLGGKGISLPVVLDTYEKQAKKFGVGEALPRTFVVDSAGRLAAVLECEGPDFASVIKGVVKSDAAGKGK